MTAPCIGPHMRSQAIGGPAWNSRRSSISGQISRAGRTSSHTGSAARICSMACALAALMSAPMPPGISSSSISASTRPSSGSPPAGGRHSTCR